MFQKNSHTDKENYRPVSILPKFISKIYERYLHKQFHDYFAVIFSRGFQKGLSIVNCFLPMIEKWRESLDEGVAYGALLTDLSKFDCLPHEFIVGYLRAPFLVHYCLIYLYVAFLRSCPKIVFLITLVIIPHTQHVTGSTTIYLI